MKGLHALAILPVMHQGQLLAVLNLASHTHDAVPANTRNTLETLARHIGSALQRLRADAEVHKSRQNLHALFDAMDDFVFVVDGTGHILQVNAAVRDRLGYAPEELAGQSILTVHPAEKRAEAATIIDAMLAGRSDTFSVPLQAKDGALIRVETRVTGGNWDGQPAFFGISRDISARLHGEAHTAELHERLDLATKVASVGIWEWDLTSNTVTWDDRMFEIYGIAPIPRVPYTIWATAVHPDDLPAVEAAEQAVIANRTQGILEFRIIRPDGRTRTIYGVEGVVTDEHGTVTRVIGVNLDATERRQMQDELQRLAAIVESANDAIIGTDLNGVIVSWNRSAEKLYGYTAGDAIGQSIAVLFPSVEQHGYVTKAMQHRAPPAGAGDSQTECHARAAGAGAHGSARRSGGRSATRCQSERRIPGRCQPRTAHPPGWRAGHGRGAGDAVQRPAQRTPGPLCAGHSSERGTPVVHGQQPLALHRRDGEHGDSPARTLWPG